MEKKEFEKLIDEKLSPIRKDIQHIKNSLRMIVEVMEKSNRRYNLRKVIENSKN